MDEFFKILDTLGNISTGIVIVAFIISLYKWIVGISPALWRLGKGLASRKIAVFANADDFNSLRSLLIDSNLFKEKNICQVTEKECKKAEGYSVFLVHWKSASGYFDQILTYKRDATSLIVYAPQAEGLLPTDDVTKINHHRNAILVNMRGRLLNDIVASLITTSYEKK